jgi:hypothetical protein
LCKRNPKSLFASAYFVSAYVCESFSFPLVLWNCLVCKWAHQAQLVVWPARAHISWFIRGVCPLHDDLEKRLGKAKKGVIGKTFAIVSASRWTHPINNSFPCVLRNCLVRQMGPPGAAGSLASAGTYLLVYKRCVPLARQPQEEAGNITRST